MLLMFSCLLCCNVFCFIALDTVRLLVWLIPEGGLTETLKEPEFQLRGK